MANPYARLYQPDNPYTDLFDRHEAAAGEGLGGPWESVTPLVQRRKRADGSYETRPNPSAIPGGEPGLGAAPPDSLGSRLSALGDRAYTAAAEGLVSIPEIVPKVAGLVGPAEVTLPDALGGGTYENPWKVLDREGVYPTIGAPGGFLDLHAQREDIHRQHAAARERLLASEGDPAVLAAVDSAAEVAGQALPFLSAAKAAGGAAEMVGQRGSAAARGGAELLPEEAAVLARRERGLRNLPAADEPFVGPGAVRDAFRPEGDILVVGGQGSRAAQDAALGLRGPDVEDLARVALDDGYGPFGPPPARPFDELADDALASLGVTPARHGLQLAAPPGSPVTVGPTLQTSAGFQTNLFAQVGEPEVRDYIVQKSDEIAAAIGGPQSWDDVEELAMRLGTDKETLLKRSPRFALMSKEERARLTMVIKGNEQDISGLQAKLAAGEATPEEQARLLRQIGERGSLIKLAVGVGSEYGRALNSLKMEARAALGQDALARQTIYRHYKAAIEQDAGLLDALGRLDPSRPDELQAFLRNVDKPKAREYAQEYWISSILSGPPTHERNLIGNAFNAVAENLLVRPVRAALDPVVAAAQGRAREHFLRETPAAATGLALGIRKGLARGLEVLRRGYDTEGVVAGKLLPVRSAFARSQNRVVREVVGPVVTGSLRLLAASDAVFKTMNHTAEIYAQAANAAAREGLAGGAFASRMADLVANPSEQMLKAANEFALKATFNDQASQFGQAFINLRETVPHVGGFIAPFVKISDRLMVRGFEYTPVGLIRAARAPKGTAAVTDLASRGAIGSAVMLGAATLAIDGRLTGTAPTDPGERAAFYAAGKQPWSAKIGETWVPFGQLQPLATPLALVAAAHEGWVRNQEAPDADKLAAAATQVGQYVTDQSYMDSVGKFFDAVSGGDGAVRAGSDLATNTAAGFMPFSGLQRSIAQAVDPRLIDARTVGEKVRAQIPGQSRGMLAKLDPWGEEVVPEGGATRGFLAKGTILTPSRERANPLDIELSRLGILLGPVGATLYDPVDRKASKLTREDHYFYQQTAGRKTKELLGQLFADPDYQAGDAEQQRAAAERLIGMSRQYARMMLLARRHQWEIP